jgi:hypothetical protein
MFHFSFSPYCSLSPSLPLFHPYSSSFFLSPLLSYFPFLSSFIFPSLSLSFSLSLPPSFSSHYHPFTSPFVSQILFTALCSALPGSIKPRNAFNLRGRMACLAFIAGADDDTNGSAETSGPLRRRSFLRVYTFQNGVGIRDCGDGDRGYGNEVRADIFFIFAH